MTRTLALFCILGGLVLALVLNLIMLPPDSAAQEPEPRPSPTPQPWIQLAPDQAVAGQDVGVLVTGLCWPSPGLVTLIWEGAGGPSLLPGPLEVGLNGDFSANVFIPASWATSGTHLIVAIHSAGPEAAAGLSFAPPTATDTPSPTPTPTPTDTQPPRPSPTWTPTPSRTVTPTPSRTMRPVTPDVSSTPLPAATPRPATATPEPQAVVPTGTEAPTATPTAASGFLAMVSPTPEDTVTPTATPSATPTPTWTPAATATRPPVPRETRGPGGQVSQIATSRPAALVEAALEESPPEAGTRWESGFVQGFVAAVAVLSMLIVLVLLVLATLYVAWRLRRARG